MGQTDDYLVRSSVSVLLSQEKIQYGYQYAAYTLIHAHGFSPLWGLGLAVPGPESPMGPMWNLSEGSMLNPQL